MSRRLDRERLRALRRERGLTQWDLALKAGVGIGTVRESERGGTYQPYPQTMRRLASALGCTVDDLLTEEATKATGP